MSVGKISLEERRREIEEKYSAQIFQVEKDIIVNKSKLDKLNLYFEYTDKLTSSLYLVPIISDDFAESNERNQSFNGECQTSKVSTYKLRDYLGNIDVEIDDFSFESILNAISMEINNTNDKIKRLNDILRDLKLSEQIELSSIGNRYSDYPER